MSDKSLLKSTNQIDIDSDDYVQNKSSIQNYEITSSKNTTNNTMIDIANKFEKLQYQYDDLQVKYRQQVNVNQDLQESNEGLKLEIDEWQLRCHQTEVENQKFKLELEDSLNEVKILRQKLQESQFIISEQMQSIQTLTYQSQPRTPTLEKQQSIPVTPNKFESWSPTPSPQNGKSVTSTKKTTLTTRRRKSNEIFNKNQEFIEQLQSQYDNSLTMFQQLQVKYNNLEKILHDSELNFHEILEEKENVIDELKQEIENLSHECAQLMQENENDFGNNKFVSPKALTFFKSKSKGNSTSNSESNSDKSINNTNNLAHEFQIHVVYSHPDPIDSICALGKFEIEPSCATIGSEYYTFEPSDILDDIRSAQSIQSSYTYSSTPSDISKNHVIQNLRSTNELPIVSTLRRPTKTVKRFITGKTPKAARNVISSKKEIWNNFASLTLVTNINNVTLLPTNFVLKKHAFIQTENVHRDSVSKNQMYNYHQVCCPRHKIIKELKVVMKNSHKIDVIDEYSRLTICVMKLIFPNIVIRTQDLLQVTKGVSFEHIYETLMQHMIKVGANQNYEKNQIVMKKGSPTFKV